MKKLILTLLVTLPMAACVSAGWLDKSPEVEYSNPSDVYGHNIFATPHEFSAMTIDGGQEISALEGSVFEGIEPLYFHAKAEGKNYIVATQSDFELGAYLTLYVQGGDGEFKLVDQTKPIGRSHRWLALSFAQDIDGNGYPEIGYVETPHLNGTAKLFEVVDGNFVFKDEFQGVTNHTIGSDEIVGGWTNMSSGGSQMWRLKSQIAGEWVDLIWDGRELKE